MTSALIRPRSDTSRPAWRARARTAARSTRGRPAAPELRPPPPRLTRRPAAMNGASAPGAGPGSAARDQSRSSPVQAERHRLGALRPVQVISDHHGHILRHGANCPKQFRRAQRDTPQPDAARSCPAATRTTTTSSTNPKAGGAPTTVSVTLRDRRRSRGSMEAAHTRLDLYRNVAARLGYLGAQSGVICVLAEAGRRSKRRTACRVWRLRGFPCRRTARCFCGSWPSEVSACGPFQLAGLPLR